jgi:ribosomal protein L37AE/L43A
VDLLAITGFVPAPNPYTPSRATGEDEDEQLVRKAKEPVRTGIFLGLFIAIVAANVLFVGGLAGVILAAIGAGVLAALYRLTTRTPKSLNPAHTAGGEACPHCGSMQTDKRYEPGEVLVWVCFACDERWRARP